MGDGATLRAQGPADGLVVTRSYALSVAGGLLLVCVLAGCAGPLEPGRLPTEEERCAFQGGSFHGGLCHTRGGQ